MKHDLRSYRSIAADMVDDYEAWLEREGYDDTIEMANAFVCIQKIDTAFWTCEVQAIAEALHDLTGVAA